MGLMFTLYGNIATFYPPYNEKHHPTVTDTMVGIVLSMFEAGILISSPFVSMLLSKVGRKNFVIIGNILMVVASMCFGLLVYVENDTVFFILSLIFRMT